jgi:hypothetical protein
MAEIKDAKSAFDTLDKDIVQEWLAHPGTIELTRQIDVAIANQKNALVDHASRSYDLDDDVCGGYVKVIGATLNSLAHVRSLIEEAQRYANSI